jgi:Spy/CpxP family protein refolding chaperone
MNGRIAISVLAALLLASQPAWAEKESGSYGRHMGERGYGHDMMSRHGGTGQYIRYVLKNQKEIGLSEEQVNKLKAIQLEFDKTRIKTEADILVAERELQALVEDYKSDLGAVEAKLKQSEGIEVQLRLAAIKAKRDARAVLTPEQIEKLRAEHDKAMKEGAKERKMMHEKGGESKGMHREKK